MIASSQDRTGGHIDGEDNESSDAQCPGNAELLNHSLDGKRHGQATDSRSGRGDAVGEATPLAKPLRDNRESGHVDETTAHADKDTLRQEELPYSGGEGGSDESAGDAEDAGSEREFHMKVAAGLGCEGRHEHGHGEVETPNEGVI